MKRSFSFNNNDVCLYLVSTPIGNLDDITYRAVNILKMVDYIYAEDTRNSKVLLNHYNIKTSLLSYHEHNELLKVNEIIAHLKRKKNVAIISDAGLPLISDPGYIIVKECINENISVSTIPGPSAGITALCSSGIDTLNYSFYGFLDSKISAKRKFLKTISFVTSTLIFYEAPHRIKETLAILKEELGDRYICLARELTKKFEEYIRGNISEIIDICDDLKGEMVVIVSGYVKEEVKVEDLVIEVEKLITKNYKTKDAVKEISEMYEVSKNQLYDLYIKHKG